MHKKIWQLLYYLFVTPLALTIFNILALFVGSIRKGVWPRYQSFRRLNDWLEKQDKDRPLVLFHAASMGEFEHIRPVLAELKQRYQTTNVVMFFSPSGYRNIRETEGLDFHLYMPFDTPIHWRRFFERINPRMLIVAKHDVWPAQIWTAKRLKIPTFLINASLAERSSRTRKVIKRFLKHVYRDFDQIFAISQDDGQRFAHHYPRCRVNVIGDTKYDQVVLRKRLAEKQDLFADSWLKDGWRFVAGSIWPEDQAHLFPALYQLLSNEPRLHLILVPHEPTTKAVAGIRKFFIGFKSGVFSERDQLKNERILVVDAIGYLAGLYRYAHAAYVGGSFRQGIHNVMEPAIYGIPVLYGPVHENSYEAIRLSVTGGGIVIRNESEVRKHISELINDELRREKLGANAEQFAAHNTGATVRLLDYWTDMFKKGTD